MARIIVSTEVKEIVSMFESLRGRYSLREIFTDWCKITAISFFNVRFSQTEIGKEREAEYERIMSKYTKEETEVFASIIGKLQLKFLENGIDDYLGKIYMGLNFGDKSRSQVFTPFHVSKMMAEMSFGDIDTLKKEGVITVNDCCVGGGAMPLAAASVFVDHDIPIDRMFFVGQDIDINCCYMAYVQLCMACVPAIIACGNALTKPFPSEDYDDSDLWRTPFFTCEEKAKYQKLCA